MPFVQGHLRKEYLSCEITTECGHCGKPIQMTLDSELKWRLHETEAAPLVFEPQIDWSTFEEPSIIDAY